MGLFQSKADVEENIRKINNPFLADVRADAIASTMNDDYLKQTAEYLNSNTVEEIQKKIKQTKPEYKLACYAYMKLLGELSKAKKFNETLKQTINRELSSEQLKHLEGYYIIMKKQWDEVATKMK